jgi:hypothetical protein
MINKCFLHHHIAWYEERVGNIERPPDEFVPDYSVYNTWDAWGVPWDWKNWEKDI